MLSLDLKELNTQQIHACLLGAVGPRPIAFASTIDTNGVANLAPFSFFNVFSANPPIAVFSPARSGRTGTTKDTYNNIKNIPEVVINIVNYDMVHQMSLASSPYPSGVDEFIKAGFTKLAATKIRPFRVAESPVQLECKVKEVIELGTGGGGGNMVICEVLMIHIREEVLDENKQIDQTKIDLVARMGGNWYCRAHGNALFEIEKPITTIGIGVDAIPEHIRNSKILTGNDLGQLGSVEQLPVSNQLKDDQLNSSTKMANNLTEEEKHLRAKELLAQKKVPEAWSVLLGA